MGKFSPDRVKARIAEILSRSRPEEDVMVRIEKVPYGLWIWDERGRVHEHFSPAAVARELGIPRAEAPEVVLSWKDVSE